MAGIVKDAGDDPDVTHGALVRRHGTARCRAGSGRRLPRRPRRRHGHQARACRCAVGEPAINPVPRQMMREHVAEVAARARRHRRRRGRDLRRPRRGDRPLAPGTRGSASSAGCRSSARPAIVVPYSCSAWIDSIRRGIDVARAAGPPHVAGCTGSTSARRSVAELYGLPEDALLDMGDFAGAVLKYLRRHPVAAADHRRRHRQAVQARRRPPRPALGPLPGRPGLPRRAGPARRRGRGAGRRGAPAPTPGSTRCSCARPPGVPLGDLVAAGGPRRPRSACCAARPSRSTSSASTARARSWAAARSASCPAPVRR